MATKGVQGKTAPVCCFEEWKHGTKGIRGQGSATDKGKETWKNPCELDGRERPVKDKFNSTNEAARERPYWGGKAEE